MRILLHSTEAYGWDVTELKEKKEKCAEFGIDMEMVAIPLAHLNVNGGSIPNFMLGNYEEGDKEIELVCNMIKQAAEAGIPAIKYFLCAMENQRTESKPPRARRFLNTAHGIWRKRIPPHRDSMSQSPLK